MDATELKGKKGLTRVVNAFGYSMNGFMIAWKNEAAFRQEIVLAVLLLPVVAWLDVSTLERIALIGVLALVLIVELINTAIENAIDRIGPERHQLSGHAKDLGSAAVFVALALTLYVWGVIVFDALT
ncbi:diacylglycerol kinase [Pseudomaricurvus alcaniphilus]|uniref:diacylglycerol kinase n=1 Tax=Pseudomaricurvus alcaniphilus TaxID=1166482 RepID=UPI0014081656|nr:diacylglycerol kinase [Pseudomaricurvus alcaniphilus]NHN38599.1 diacylglycerol kinase [Pseudomaricurvus alcaniphilus]